VNQTTLIERSLAGFSTLRQDGGGVAVSTHCLYPGGDGVTVRVDVESAGYRVSDDGGGWTALLQAGIDPSPSQLRRAHSVAEDGGIAFDEGAFLADEIGESQLGAAILMVANASQRWVRDVLDEQERRVERDLKRRVLEQLKRLFPAHAIEQDRSIAGDSTKAYHIAQIVKLDNRLLLIEPVANQANALAATFLKFSDIGKAHNDWPREAVIQGKSSWRAEDVNVLAEVSTGVTDIETGLDPIRSRYAPPFH
jgi:hypothetical protein